MSSFKYLSDLLAEELSAAIVAYLQQQTLVSSRDIAAHVDAAASYATVKRRLAELARAGILDVKGKARATRYALHDAYELIRPIDPESYFKTGTDDRQVRTAFNHELFPLLESIEIFSVEEKALLGELHRKHSARLAGLSADAQKQELERLAIDLSWKSSQIEGNTYSLLETERLLLEKRTAEGKTLEEATMLLNHKAAIDFLVTHPDYVEPLQVHAIEDVHALLVRDLGVDRNLRQRTVTITGTKYRPIDNEFQIREAMIDVCRLINAKDDPYEKALLFLLLVSYIQPFSDGNKRTARIVSNGLLLARGYCPLSFRSVEPLDYKKAMLIFYETNNISVFKEIFLGQAEFAVNTYF